jgi:hypothetical protein
LKWYKHLAKSIDNPFVRQLMYEFGSDAYLVFFGTLEIYSDNFSPENGWKLTVSLRYFHEKFLLSNSKIKNILEKITEWEVTFNKDEVTVFIPKFKELLDNYTSDNSNKTSKKLPSDKEETFQPIRIKNKEADKEEELNKANKGKDAFLEELKKAIDETKFRYPLPKEQYEIENWIKCHIRGANKKAIIHSINSLVKAPEKIEKIPFYLDAVFKMENQNYNAIEHEQKSAEYKKHDLTGLRAVLNNIVR